MEERREGMLDNEVTEPHANNNYTASAPAQLLRLPAAQLISWLVQALRRLAQHVVSTSYVRYTYIRIDT